MWVEELSSRTAQEAQAAEQSTAGDIAAETSRLLPLKRLLLTTRALLITQIAAYLRSSDLAIMCDSDPGFAYRFCGVELPIDDDSGLRDADVVWELWQVILQRDFGVSANPDDCSADAPYFRQMAASALARFIEVEIGNSDANTRLTEPNRTRLLAYKSLHRILYNSKRNPLDLNRFTTYDRARYGDRMETYVSSSVHQWFGLEHGIMVLRITKAPHKHTNIIVSVIAVANALADLSLRGGSAREVLRALRHGHYGEVFTQPVLLSPTNSGSFKSNYTKFVVPRNRWLMEGGFAGTGVRPGGMDSENLDELAKIPDTPTIEPFLNDDGNEVLFNVLREPAMAPGVFIIEQYRAVPPAASAAIELTYRVKLGDTGHRVTAAQDVRPFDGVSQTEQTYMNAIDHNPSPFWYSKYAVFDIVSFATLQRVFTLRLRDLIVNNGLPELDTHYRALIRAHYRKLPDGSFAGRYVMCISHFHPQTSQETTAYDNALPQDIEYERTGRRIHLVKIDLNADGTVHTAELYIIPRIFHDLSNVRTVSSRIAVIELDNASAIIDWQRKTVQFCKASDFNPFRGMLSNDNYVSQLTLPTLAFGNYNLPDSVPLPADDTRNPSTSILQQYVVGDLEPIDLPLD